VTKRGLRVDEDAVLAKPFEPDALLAKVRDVLLGETVAPGEQSGGEAAGAAA
jgi:DNA-binding response OmpR family regulator